MLVVLNKFIFIAFRRLVGHLDAVLEDGDRKCVGRVAGQPETEVRVRFVGVQFFTDSLELRHPGRRQVAVL